MCCFVTGRCVGMDGEHNYVHTPFTVHIELDRRLAFLLLLLQLQYVDNQRLWPEQSWCYHKPPYKGHMRLATCIVCIKL